MEYAGVHIPAGCTVEVGDTIEDLVDIGVIPMDTDSTVQITYDVVKTQGSKREDVLTYIKNMVAKASTEIYQIRLDVINRLTGGAMNVTTVAGAVVSGATHTIAGGWAKESLYVLAGQNTTGDKQTITNIKQGSTTLVAGTDYVQAKNAAGDWGIILLSGSSAATASTLTVTYSYTPSSAIKATMGAGNVSIASKVIRFKKEIGGKKFQVTLYSAKMTNGIKLSFPGSDADKPASLPIEIEGQLDTTRASGDQLLEIIDEIGVA